MRMKLGVLWSRLSMENIYHLKTKESFQISFKERDQYNDISLLIFLTQTIQTEFMEKLWDNLGKDIRCDECLA